MTERISTLDIRRMLGELLDRVHLRHDEFIIERKGKPLAALVSVEKMRELQRLARIQVLEPLQRRSSPLPQEEVDRLADEAKHDSRRTKSR